MIIYHTTKETLRRIFSAKIKFNCAWCNRWQIDGKWVKDLPLNTIIPENLSHGICPECADKYGAKYRQEIERLNRDRPFNF